MVFFIRFTALCSIRLRQPLQFTEEEHGPASDSETDTATGNGGGADKNRLFLEFWSSSSLSLRQVESSSGDERWNRRVESDASVAPSPTTVAASEEAPLLEGHGIQVAPGTARSRSQRSQRSPHRLPSLSQPPGSKSLRLRATKLPEAQSLPLRGQAEGRRQP